MTDAALQSIPAIPGVYFLYRGGAIVYVGQSSNIRDRLRAHNWDGKKFDFVRCVRISDSAKRRLYERAEIKRISPIENIRSKNTKSKFCSAPAMVGARTGELEPLVLKWMKENPGVPTSRLVKHGLRLALTEMAGKRYQHLIEME